MGLESASYPNQLVATNPTGSDPKSTADDHIRLLKSVIQTTFPNLTGAMTAAQADLNKVGVTQPQTSNDTSVSSTAFVQTAVAAAITAIGAGASMWVSGTTYALGNVVWSPSNYQTYRRIIAGAGTTDPASDATNWVLVSGNVQTTATQTLTNKTLDAPVITGGASISGNVSVAGAVAAVVNGSDSISNQLYGQNVAGTRAFNWQLTAAGNPALWAYNGSSWSKVIEGSSSGLAVTGTGSFTGAVNFGQGGVANAILNTSALGMYFNVDSDANEGVGSGFFWGTDRATDSGGTTWMSLDTGGNLGLGITPSAWGSSHQAFQVGARAALWAEKSGGNLYLTNNAYYNGANHIYIGTAPASNYRQVAGEHSWQTAPSGTAGNAISFTQAMTLDASGNLLPGANGTQAFGSTSLRWSQVWCTAGAFNTSDAALKTPIRTMQAKELAAGYQMAQELGTFQWLESVKEKGDKARRHVGLTVQRAAEILESHGLDPWAYGFMGFDKWAAVTEIVDATKDDEGAYLEEVTRQKTEKQTSQHPAIEIVNGKPVLKVETVESDVPITEQIQVVDADGKPVFTDVPEVPMLHAVPVMETVQVWKRVKEVRPAGESYAFRSDQLAFFIAAGVAAKVGA